MTDDFSGTDTLRHRLLVAGTNEIGQYGIANFSLRRVAAACGTSCAAPYRHFKNKEAFILEILRYIEGQWELLCSQILSLYEGDIRKQLIEVCIAYIRFWVANPELSDCACGIRAYLGCWETGGRRVCPSGDPRTCLRVLSALRQRGCAGTKILQDQGDFIRDDGDAGERRAAQ